MQLYCTQSINRDAILVVEKEGGTLTHYENGHVQEYHLPSPIEHIAVEDIVEHGHFKVVSTSVDGVLTDVYLPHPTDEPQNIIHATTDMPIIRVALSVRGAHSPGGPQVIPLQYEQARPTPRPSQESREHYHLQYSYQVGRALEGCTCNVLLCPEQQQGRSSSRQWQEQPAVQGEPTGGPVEGRLISLGLNLGYDASDACRREDLRLYAAVSGAEFCLMDPDLYQALLSNGVEEEMPKRDTCQGVQSSASITGSVSGGQHTGRNNRGSLGEPSCKKKREGTLLADTSSGLSLGCFLSGTCSGQVWASSLATAWGEKGSSTRRAGTHDWMADVEDVGPPGVPKCSVVGARDPLAMRHYLLFNLGEAVRGILPLGRPSADTPANPGYLAGPSGALLLVGGQGRVVALRCRPSDRVPLRLLVRVMHTQGGLKGGLPMVGLGGKQLEVRDWHLGQPVDAVACSGGGVLVYLSGGQVYACAMWPQGPASGGPSMLHPSFVGQLRPTACLLEGPVQQISVSGSLLVTLTTAGCLYQTSVPPAEELHHLEHSRRTTRAEVEAELQLIRRLMAQQREQRSLMEATIEDLDKQIQLKRAEVEIFARTLQGEAGLTGHLEVVGVTSSSRHGLQLYLRCEVHNLSNRVLGRATAWHVLVTCSRTTPSCQSPALREVPCFIHCEALPELLVASRWTKTVSLTWPQGQSWNLGLGGGAQVTLTLLAPAALHRDGPVFTHLASCPIPTTKLLALTQTVTRTGPPGAAGGPSGPHVATTSFPLRLLGPGTPTIHAGDADGGDSAGPLQDLLARLHFPVPSELTAGIRTVELAGSMVACTWAPPELLKVAWGGCLHPGPLKQCRSGLSHMDAYVMGLRFIASDPYQLAGVHLDLLQHLASSMAPKFWPPQQGEAPGEQTRLPLSLKCANAPHLAAPSAVVPGWSGDWSSSSALSSAIDRRWFVGVREGKRPVQHCHVCRSFMTGGTGGGWEGETEPTHSVDTVEAPGAPVKGTAFENNKDLGWALGGTRVDLQAVRQRLLSLTRGLSGSVGECGKLMRMRRDRDARRTCQESGGLMQCHHTLVAVRERALAQYQELLGLMGEILAMRGK